MNEFQSPYIEGQVIAPAEAEPSLHGFEDTQPLSIASKRSRAAASPRRIVCRRRSNSHTSSITGPIAPLISYWR